MVKMMKSSFVVVAVGGNNQYYHLGFENTVYQMVLFRQFATPAPFWLSFQRLGMAKSCLGVGGKFLNKAKCFLIDLRFVFSKAEKMLLLFGGENKFKCHILSSLASVSRFLQATNGCNRLFHRLVHRVLSWQKTRLPSSGWNLSSLLPVWPHIWRGVSSTSRHRLWHLCSAKVGCSVSSS